jgi:alpha-glucosidase
VSEVYEEVPETGRDYEPLGVGELADHGDRTLRFRVGSTTVEVSALAAGVFRVGMFPNGRPVRYDSPAIAQYDWDPVEVAMEQGDDEVTLSTPEATVHVALDPLRVRFTDPAGREFAADDPGLGMGLGTLPKDADVFSAPLGNPVRLYKKRTLNERYFGCGERTSGLEKTGSHQIFWNVDPPIGHTASYNNLYSSVPFTLSLAGGKAHGLFFDNTHRVEFDLALEDEGRAYYGAEGGDVVYYVFCGPTPREVLDGYTQLTGRTPMPPLWSLGNQQCRYSYMDEAEVRDIAQGYRERDIPCDVIYLDIHYMDGYRVFTWNDERFPDPKGMISDLEAQGFRVVTIVDPGVKVDEGYETYRTGRAADLFCKTDGGEEYHNVVWPGMCAFPDFTSPEARAWWGANHSALVDEGVAGIWCDMNEPALFVPHGDTMPDYVVHPGGSGGEPRYHAQVHNTYGLLMAQATREGLLKLRPHERPFVISRSGYAGLQRHAMQWTGDNSSWWEHLWMSMPQLQNLGLSGIAWAGVDIGGFWGDTNAELLARWYEFGVFQPYCRNHTAIGTRYQEPWQFGEGVEDVARRMLKLRQRLLAYLYGLFEECHRTGAPILRPLLFEYPEDETTYTADDEFLLGHAILVAPIVRPGIEHRHVYLPAGSWFHLWTGDRTDGPAHVLAHAPLGQPAVYVKANEPVPMGPDANHTGENTAGPLTLAVYPAAGAEAGETVLYEDAGNGFAYRDGEYARRTVSCEASGGRIAVRISAREGSYVPERGELLLELRGVENPRSVRVDGESREMRSVDGATVVSLEESARGVSVEVEL